MPWQPPPEFFGTLDPGKDHAALTVWLSNRAVFAKKFVAQAPWPVGVQRMATEALLEVHGRFGRILQLLVVEYPEIRIDQWRRAEELDIAKQNAINEELQYLTFTDGAFMSALGAPTETVKPSLWKSNIAADTLIEERIKPKLSAEERAAVVGKADHNVWDSFGIGLWRIGRLHPGRR